MNNNSTEIQKITIKTPVGEQTIKFFKTELVETWRFYIRNAFRTLFLIGGGAIIGALAIANSISPRIGTVEAKVLNIETGQTKFQSDVANDIEDLKDSDREQKVQIQMLVLYQIPKTERIELQQEAEKIVKSQE